MLDHLDDILDARPDDLGVSNSDILTLTGFTLCRYVQ